ncbi:SDR family NAD(P)-dependent oxidoreductase [Streptomyces sp. B8F3]|uniref:SDR family NAD(P)-dependent oxidoreductase n=1 Tax=Streptomyces sp. B8F3 TaxID=3153573 RepID=UPI00325F4E63
MIITGGGTGIGRATAQLFATAGAEVLIVGRTAERLPETATQHARIRTCVADIAEVPSAPRARGSSPADSPVDGKIAVLEVVREHLIDALHQDR